MKKNKILEELRASTPAYIKNEVDNSFATVRRIQAILKAKGMSNRDLAQALGKSESEISKWMTGVHNFTYRTVSKIEAVLGEKILNFGDKVTNHFLFQSNIGDQKITLSIEGVFKDVQKSVEGNFQAVNTNDVDEVCSVLN